MEQKSSRFCHCPCCGKQIPIATADLHITSSACRAVDDDAEQTSWKSITNGANKTNETKGCNSINAHHHPDSNALQTAEGLEQGRDGATAATTTTTAAAAADDDDNSQQQDESHAWGRRRTFPFVGERSCEEHDVDTECKPKKQRVDGKKAAWPEKMRNCDRRALSHTKHKQHTSKAASSTGGLISWERLPKPGKTRFRCGESYLHGQFVIEEFVTEQEEQTILDGLWDDEQTNPFAWQSKGIGAQMWGKTYGQQIMYGRNRLGAPVHPLPTYLLNTVVPRLCTALPGLTDRFMPTECNALLYYRGKSWLKPHVDDRSLSTDLIMNLRQAMQPFVICSALLLKCFHCMASEFSFALVVSS